MSNKMKLTDYVVDFLEKKGIHDFFGYQGTMIAHLVDSIEKNPDARSHSSYNEQGAAFAACGYAQAMMPADVPMLQAARELPICFPVWLMLILIHFR